MKCLYRLFAILALMLVHYAPAEGYCDTVTVDWRKEVLKVNTACRKTTTIGEFDEGFDTKKLVTTGVSVASNFAPAGPFIKSVLSIFGFFGGLSEKSWQQALNEQFYELVRCMDSKLLDYQRGDIEAEWRGLMVSYNRSIATLAEGGAKNIAQQEVRELFKKMTERIEADFGSPTLPLQTQYLKAEALLPVLKVITEVFWLTFTTHLSLTKEWIESGAAGAPTHTNYNKDLQHGQQDLKKLADWAETALEVIHKQYEPTVTCKVWFYHTAEWRIEWQNNQQLAKGSCSTGFTKANWRGLEGEMTTQFINRLMIGYYEYIREIEGTYVTPLVDVSISAYLIPKYGETRYYQVTPVGMWINCPNLQSKQTDNILEVISDCNKADDCIGFNWYNDAGGIQHLKKDGEECLGTGDGEPYRSIWKSTKKWCYQETMVDRVPHCDALPKCGQGSEEAFEQSCDNDDNCIGFFYAESIKEGCFIPKDCSSRPTIQNNGFTYKSKCSTLNITFSNDEPLPFYFGYRTHIIASVLVFAFVFVTICLCFITKKIFTMNKTDGFKQIPKEIDSDY